MMDLSSPVCVCVRVFRCQQPRDDHREWGVTTVKDRGDCLTQKSMFTFTQTVFLWKAYFWQLQKNSIFYLRILRDEYIEMNNLRNIDTFLIIMR